MDTFGNWRKNTVMKLITVSTGSVGNAYLFEDGNRRILLDAGFQWKGIDKACGYGVIDAAFITHEHG